MRSLLRPLHLAVIDPGVKTAELDNFNRLVLAAPDLCLSLHMPALFGMNSLQFLSQKPDALLICGSAASVYDELPWQAPLNAWLLQAISDGLPTLGICYGHQLLAYLLGGKVEFATASHEKFKGLRQVTFHRRGFWGEIGTKGPLVVSHSEVVTQLPIDCDSVAQSPDCQIESFAHRHLPLWGIQAHPEAGPEFVHNQSIDLSLATQPFTFGQDYLRKFTQHLLQSRIQ